MENSADALKIAFAILVFVIAITITFSVISKAKTTADVVLFHNNKTNFYEHLESSDTNRVVSVTDVISTLYRYYKESISVTVVIGSESKTFDLSNSFSNINAIESDLAIYIEDYLLVLPEESTFTEEFVEAPISGIYEKGEDETEITISSGGKKVYVTYTLQ